MMHYGSSVVVSEQGQWLIKLEVLCRALTHAQFSGCSQCFIWNKCADNYQVQKHTLLSLYY